MLEEVEKIESNDLHVSILRDTTTKELTLIIENKNAKLEINHDDVLKMAYMLDFWAK